MMTDAPSHFFKVVLNETLRDKKMHIPRKFMRKIGKTLSSPVILQLACGLEWNIELETCNGEVWLQKGWPEFACHYSLEQGHFLVFRYEGNSRFHVIILDASATEIDYPINPTTPFSKSHIDKDKLREPKKEEIEIDDVSETGDESSSQCLRPHKKTKTSVTTCIPNSKVDLKKKHHYLSSIEKARAVDGFKSENPFFSISVQPSYVLRRGHDVVIPKSFARRYIKKKEGDFTLRISDGRTWSVQYKTRRNSRTAHECTGISSCDWYSFACQNNLQVLDVCIFELISSDSLHFHVSIIRHKDPIFPDGKRETDPVSRQKKTARAETGSASMHNLGDLHKSSNKTNVNTREENIIGSERYTALERAVSGFKSENPFFSIVMQPSYIKGNGDVNVPSKFVARHVNKRQADFNLRVPNGRCWPVRYKAARWSGTVNRTDWKPFARANRLEVGDVCIFELINSENDVLLFQVSFVRCSGQPFQYGDQGTSNPEKEETCTVPVANQTAEKESQVQHAEKSSSGRPPSSGVAFGSKNSSFYVCMTAYHFDHGLVAIPSSFAKSCIEKRTQNVKLIMGQRCWEVKLIIIDEGKLFFSKGWSAFARENCMIIGDVCRFEKLEDNPIVFNVSITRAF